MKKKLTILFLVTDDWFFLMHRKALALAAQDAGFQVLVATAPGPKVKEIEGLGFTHYPLKMRRASRNPFREVVGLFDLVKLYRCLQPDIVHQVSIKPIIYGSLAAQIAGVPAVVNAVTGLGFVFIAGGRLKNILRSLVEAAYRFVGKRTGVRFLFENPDDLDHFLKKQIIASEKAVLILGSGVDVKRFKPQVSRPESESGTKKPVVLLAARLLWHKGIREFVEAARILLCKGVEAQFWLAGMPDSSNPAAVPVSRLLFWHRQGNIRWLGFQKDMPALYQQADVVCLPTRYREGIPVTLLEAAASGKPLVATDMPGCREIVRSGENGFLVVPGDISDLVAALEKLLLDVQLRDEFGLNGRRLVENGFSDKKVISDTFAVYKDLLREKWFNLEKS
ncbi:glycosyltransferase family 4 protein [bacterium]|nr:glycosyltransferase family 4 protein [bacterium]